MEFDKMYPCDFTDFLTYEAQKSNYKSLLKYINKL